MGLLRMWRHHLANEANRRVIGALPSRAEHRRVRDAQRRAERSRGQGLGLDILQLSQVWLAKARAQGNAEDITALEAQVRRYGGDPSVPTDTETPPTP